MFVCSSIRINVIVHRSYYSNLMVESLSSKRLSLLNSLSIPLSNVHRYPYLFVYLNTITAFNLVYRLTLLIVYCEQTNNVISSYWFMFSIQSATQSVSNSNDFNHFTLELYITWVNPVNVYSFSSKHLEYSLVCYYPTIIAAIYKYLTFINKMLIYKPDHCLNETFPFILQS